MSPDEDREHQAYAVVPTDTVAAATPTPAPLGPGAAWEGRRRPTRRERLIVGGFAVLLVVYLALLAASAEWAAHPVLASSTVAVGAVSLGLLLASARAYRPNRPRSVEGPSLHELPEPTRGALLVDLRAGRPGPPELRRYAASWTCQNLQAPHTQAVLPALVAMNAGVLALDSDLAPTVQLVLLTIVAVTALACLVGWARQRRAADRIADALDQLTPPPPPVPTSTDAR